MFFWKELYYFISSVPEPNSSTDCLFEDLLSFSNLNSEIRGKVNADTGVFEDFIEVWDEKGEGAGDSRTSLSLNR